MTMRLKVKLSAQWIANYLWIPYGLLYAWILLVLVKVHGKIIVLCKNKMGNMFM